MIMKAKNMRNRSGNAIPNQLIIENDNGDRLFQSYNHIIAKIDVNGNTFLDMNFWDYSNTTGKYRNVFLNENNQMTKRKIKSGEYKLVNLN